MSALPTNLIFNELTSLQNIIPWVSFIAGLGGGLHCVGMCGGLVTATCQSNKEIFRYQSGRLIGYIILGFFASVLGKIFTIQLATPQLTLVPGLLIGALFLFWGYQSLSGKKAEIPAPKFLRSFYTSVWHGYIRESQKGLKSFLTGFMSILLPCGLLYGVVLSLAALDYSFKAVYSMFFFWLGTLPSMIIAPSLFQKILKPLRSKLPKTYAVGLIVIGVMTISFRVIKFQNNEHHNSSKKEEKSSATKCH